GRAVLVALEAGQELGDHQAKEHAWLPVTDGTVQVESGGESGEAGTGTLVHFEPDERHSVAAPRGGARALLLPAPSPGERHAPRARAARGPRDSSPSLRRAWQRAWLPSSWRPASARPARRPRLPDPPRRRRRTRTRGAGL